MKDICYGCEVVQEYGTMRDIEETRFNIYCDACLIKGVDMTDSKQPTLSVSGQVDKPRSH